MLFTESDLRSRVQARSSILAKKSDETLREARTSASTSFDVFLSHSILDAELILGAKLKLEDFGFTVYVDWLNDPKLDRSAVSPSTAAYLRNRMKQCRMLVYVYTSNASLSKWCPWELGYLDGLKGGNVFIMPVVSGTQSSFSGQEYLGLYPYLDRATASQNIIIEKVEGFHYLSEAKSRSFVRKVA